MKKTVFIRIHPFILCCLFLSVAVDASTSNVTPNQFNHNQWLNQLGSIEQAKLLADDGMATDYFGAAVSLSGNWAVVGSIRHDAVANDAGAAYVYEFDGSFWVFKQKLTADDGASNDQFGYAVSISGEQIMVSAIRDDDNNGDSGSVYVFGFDHNANNWVQTQKLLASDGSNGHWFGFSISIQNNRAMIAANHENQLGSNAGAVYEFNYVADTWQEGQKLLASDGDTLDQFGQSVSLSGDRLLVGAFYHDVNAEPVGAAYVFDFDASSSSWLESQKLLSPNPESDGYFGFSVSLSGDRALIGAHQETGGAGVTGSAYLFDFDGNDWNLTQHLTGDANGSGGQFGISVGLLGNRALVGASREAYNGFNSGSAYVFDLIGNTWLNSEQLTAADNASRDEFGVSLSVLGGQVIIGAHRDGDQGSDSGSAYVFDVPFPLALQLTGLAPGNSVVLQNNAADDLQVDENGLVVFPTALFEGTGYDVTVAVQPTSPNQSCVVNQGVGVVSQYGISGITVVCVTTPYFVAGMVDGLFDDNPMVLHNNGSDPLTINQDGSFVFAIPVDDQQTYEVTINNPPVDPIQPCVVTQGQGVIQGGDVTDVRIDCAVGGDLIYRGGFE
ncbi:FG-GAP repeat protein [Marinicella litoralis]|uniref:FG-GAP repeat protein n=1 Tax=Marinicella litoralis TaxID=644220 RepID=A0A4R6XYN4_9GAMM|nr:FG-GAP repeat protein [Marinicella litoralis]TDR23357.1 FG-GAP repeat protein [Marinicella litoralis]